MIFTTLSRNLVSPGKPLIIQKRWSESKYFGNNFQWKASFVILENILQTISFQNSGKIYVRATGFIVFPKISSETFFKKHKSNDNWKENAKALNVMGSSFKTYLKVPKLWNIILRYLPFTADENCWFFKSTALFIDTTMNVKNNSNNVDFLFSLIKGDSINAQHS